KNAPEGGWIVVGGGWTPAQFPERRLPTPAELDALAPKHRGYVQYFRQAAVFKNRSLAAGGKNRQTTKPPRGRIRTRPSHGRANGCPSRDFSLGTCLQQDPATNTR